MCFVLTIPLILLLSIYQSINTLNKVHKIQIIKHNSTRFGTGLPSSESVLKQKVTIQHAIPSDNRPESGTKILKY